MKRFSRLFVFLVLAACASSPKLNYYTLSAESSGNSQPAVNLDVQRFQTTEALSRSGILIAASPTRVEYYATDQWVGGLAELVRQKLTVEFGEQVEGRRNLAMTAVVLACEQVDVAGGTEARMKLSVTVRDPAEKRYREPLLSKTYEASRPMAHSSADSVVVALSICAEQIAADIASDASGL